MLAAAPANAQTLAGITIDNTATISYSVGNVAVSREDTVSFIVDRMIDVQVVGQTSVDVLPGQTNAELLFTVQNQGNSGQAYDLTAVDLTDFTTATIWYDVGGGFVLFDGTNFPEARSGRDDGCQAGRHGRRVAGRRHRRGRSARLDP
jgi:hypothetical protein